VLVVEDEPVVRIVTVRALRESRFTVREAATGQDALEMLGDSERGRFPRSGDRLSASSLID
jgi:CheY-like chemotaxis protein